MEPVVTVCEYDRSTTTLTPITVPLALSHGCWLGIIILIYLASYKYNSHYQPARQYYNVLVLIQTRILYIISSKTEEEQKNHHNSTQE